MLVYYDLETGGVNLGFSDILEIAAVTGQGHDETFQRYVTPTQSINPGASSVNKLTSDADNNLYFNGEKVATVSLKDALVEFLGFLEGLEHKAAGCILVAHNGNRFDHRFLKLALERSGLLGDAKLLIEGFADSMPVLARAVGRSRPRLALLGAQLLGQEQTHGALADAEMLKAVLDKLEVPEATLRNGAGWDF